jgi:hypothetical protein
MQWSLICAVVAAGLTATGTAAPPPSKQTSPSRATARPHRPLEVWRGQGFAALARIEIVEMLGALAGGSPMGPGEGWFHAGQARYDWKWLAKRFDANNDGKIERGEFPGPEALFRRLDRDHDGVLTPADFDWSNRSPLVQQARPAGYLFSMLDANSNGRISREEWDAFFARASRGRGYLTVDDLREAFLPPRPAKKNGKARQGPTPAMLVKGLLSGELGSFFEGPRVGQQAPDFTLRTFDGKRRISLSEYRGKKPVVLVFGSFT